MKFELTAVSDREKQGLKPNVPQYSVQKISDMKRLLTLCAPMKLKSIWESDNLNQS